MIFSEFLGSLVLSDVEGLLLCIKTKKLERKNKIIEVNTFKDLVPEVSGFYSDDSGNPCSKLQGIIKFKVVCRTFV
jgi:hypothetical protein